MKTQYQKILEEVVPLINDMQTNNSIPKDVGILLTDIEGRVMDFLKALKVLGAISEVKYNTRTKKIEIELNKDFCGFISFNGDLTTYKTYGDNIHNKICIDIMEELNNKIQEHNKSNKNHIQFIAIPGNHEFLNGFCGKQDWIKITKDIEKNDYSSFIIKLKALKVLTQIQYNHFKYIRYNNLYDELKDDDYGLWGEQRRYQNDKDKKSYIQHKLTRLKEILNQADKFIKLAEDKKNDKKVLNIIKLFMKKIQNIRQAADTSTYYQYLEQLKTDKYKIPLGEYIALLTQLTWEHNSLFSSICFVHKQQKFRLLHHFSFFFSRQLLEQSRQITNKPANKI